MEIATPVWESFAVKPTILHLLEVIKMIKEQTKPLFEVLVCSKDSRKAMQVHILIFRWLASKFPVLILLQEDW
jgi:hypothetical protein